MRLGNRIPGDYFVTAGVGESELTIHAGSYHFALQDAGIEMANIVTYSSILPASATEVARPEITHGEVMETIMASSSCRYGESATAGIIYGWLQYPGTDRRHGGLVCEYSGSMPEQQAEEHLQEMMKELHQGGYDQYELVEVRTVTRMVTPMKMYGTALAAICFANHRFPVPTPE